jgi:BioD-like phosphotransacetylase family protein
MTRDTQTQTEPLVVTSTEESSGKTAVTLALALVAADRGERVGYMKPKGTRLQSTVGKTLDRDPMLAREVLGLDDAVHEMEPVVYSPTFVSEAIRGGERPGEIRERVREAYRSLAAERTTMLVEGGGRYTTGGVVDLTDGDVAEMLDGEAVLVAPYRTPNDVDEVLAAAESLGDRLRAVLLNRVPEEERSAVAGDVMPYLESQGIPVAGALPNQRELAGVTVADLVDELGGELLTDAPTDGFVDRFVVGAMSGEEALRFFRRTTDAAVITGGDRADVHAAAIEAPGVRCLVVTGGHRPSSSVLGRAAERDLPVLALSGDTLSTVERAEDVVRAGRTRDERTVRRMKDLLVEHVDVETLLG